MTEVGQMVQWTGGQVPTALHPGKLTDAGVWYAHYTVWPDGENRLIGDLTFPRGTVDLTCATDVVPALAWKSLLGTPGERDWQIDAVTR